MTSIMFSANHLFKSNSDTATFQNGFHALRKAIVSGTLTQNTLVLTRIVLMLRRNYGVLFFQNIDTVSVLYNCGETMDYQMRGG
jgi:hypothetical protein